MKNLRFGLVAGLALLLNSACSKEPEPGPPLVYDPVPYEIDIPSWFPPMTIPPGNPTTVQGVALGRRLYYDPILHPAGATSCAGCHFQERSFSSGPAILPHVNLGWNRNFLWNGRVQGTLEDIMYFEVAEFFKTDISRLQNHPEYPRLFYEAFGIRQISHELAAKALAQWMRTLISANSPRDQSIWGVPRIFLPDEAIDGAIIFNTERGDCFHCHGGIFFTDNQFHNIGLDAEPAEPGYEAVSGNPADRGKFKTPTLRNIALTAPYMHDGRFKTLEEVIDFYSEGVKKSPNIDPLMKWAHLGGLHLSAKEKSDLLAFLHTLTDSSFIRDPRFKSPF